MTIEVLSVGVEEIGVFIPKDDPANVSIVDIPGTSKGDAGSDAFFYVLPVTRRCTDAFRDFLRNRDYTISPDAVESLRRGASLDPGYDLTLSPDGKRIVAQVEYHKRYEEIFRSAYAKVKERGHWEVNADNVELLLYRVKKDAPELRIDPAVSSLLEEEKSLPDYSGYLAELARMSLDVLPIVKDTKRLSAEKFDKHGISNALDMIRYFPLRYIDRSHPVLIKDLVVGEEASVIGTITKIEPKPQFKLVEITIQDASGQSIRTAFFNQVWLARQYFKGDDVVLYGKYANSKSKNGKSYPGFSSPKISKIGDKDKSMPMIPVYPQSQKRGLTTWDILKVEQDIVRSLHPSLVDSIPAEVVEKYGLMNRQDAFVNIHLPTDPEKLSQARRRLVYEELFLLQVLIQQRKALYQETNGIAHSWDDSSSLAQKYRHTLPYALTGAQERAVQALDADLKKPVPMHRLLQGDVGAGKSTVATWAMLRAVDSGYQGALMAPTEMLAEQLYLGLKQDIDLLNKENGTSVSVRFLGSKLTAKQKREVTELLSSGELDIVVGTHALISDQAIYKNLGIVVIDEQHRFGTEQRTILREKRGDDLVPDVLMMTATPIPRTSSMVLYGDMDETVLDELPPGRVPIHTIWAEQNTAEVIHDDNAPCWKDIRAEVAKGHQAYVVASLVEDSETIAAASAEETYAVLQSGPLRGLRLGVVHGKQKRVDRESTMAAFVAGEIDVLVATTVIEVGVNVPNSTLMVILDSNRFGIAQLHQIRGRVGRSTIPSRCYLVGMPTSDESIQRLGALVESTDGFYLAEKDLDIRGSGQLFGTQQSGESDLRIASLQEHRKVLECAQEDASALISDDPYLQRNLLIKQEIELLFPGEIMS